MKAAVAVIIAILALAGADSLFVVSQGHAAMLTQFGRVERSGLGPGLHTKIPFVQRTAIYDTRAILLQSAPEDYTTADHDPVRAGFFVRWRVADPDVYYRATSGDELQATQQMTPVIHAALRTQIQSHKLSDLLDSGSDSVDASLRAMVAAELRQRLGVDILDVGIQRILPPDDALDAVYKRMSSDAKAQADALRAQGHEAAAVLRADGERNSRTILADARKAAAAVRGQGDAQAAKIYADASAQDPQFFAWWSSLETWRDTFDRGGAVIVLDRDSPFLRAVESGASNNVPAPQKTH